LVVLKPIEFLQNSMSNQFIQFVKETSPVGSNTEITDQKPQNLEQFYLNLLGIQPNETEIENKSEIVKQFEEWKDKKVSNHFLIPKSNIGYKLLTQNGWKETGLVKNQDGIIYPIQPSKEVVKKNKIVQKKQSTNQNHLKKGWVEKMEKERKMKEQRSRDLIYRNYF
jgi:hypothetical protein